MLVVAVTLFLSISALCMGYGRIIETKVATYMSTILGPSFIVYSNTLFAYLLGIRRISRPETWNAFLGKLKKLISDYQGIIEPIKLGFPYQWALILRKRQKKRGGLQ